MNLVSAGWKKIVTRSPDFVFFFWSRSTDLLTGDGTLPENMSGGLDDTFYLHRIAIYAFVRST